MKTFKTYPRILLVKVAQILSATGRRLICIQQLNVSNESQPFLGTETTEANFRKGNRSDTNIFCGRVCIGRTVYMYMYSDTCTMYSYKKKRLYKGAEAMEMAISTNLCMSTN